MQLNNPSSLPKAAVFIDAGHYHYNLFNKWRIDYKKLIQFLEGRGYIASFVFYYEGIPSKSSYFHTRPNATYDAFNQTKKKKKAYFKVLRSFNFIVRSKPVRRIFDKDLSQYKLKCNFDVELTMDVMDILLSKDIDVFVFCSGDGDFIRLLRRVKNQGKKTIVLGLKNCTNDELAEAAHDVIFLEAIKDKIEFK